MRCDSDYQGYTPMVILGFRPKGASAIKTKSSTKTQDIKVDTLKENVSTVTVIEESKSSKIKEDTVQVSLGNKTAKMSRNTMKFKASPQVTQVSSNWKRMKSLNVFTATDAKNNNSLNSTKTLTDAEWFGVKNVEEFAASNEDQILRENVSTASLFPPAPVGMSAEKLKLPCKFVALDCEMVGSGLKGFESILARVSVVNFHGSVLLDVYVRPTRKVVDYRTAVSGVTVGHLTPSKDDASVNIYGNPLLSLTQLQEQLVPLLHERIVVGHALNNDFSALLLSSNHPRKLIRDTSRYKPFRALSNGRSPALKMLAARILGVKIQGSSHDSVDDARIAMLLYRAVKSQWENAIFTREDRTKSNSNPKKQRNRHRDDASENESDGFEDESNIFNSIL